MPSKPQSPPWHLAESCTSPSGRQAIPRRLHRRCGQGRKRGQVQFENSSLLTSIVGIAHAVGDMPFTAREPSLLAVAVLFVLLAKHFLDLQEARALSFVDEVGERFSRNVWNEGVRDGEGWLDIT